MEALPYAITLLLILAFHRSDAYPDYQSSDYQQYEGYYPYLEPLLSSETEICSRYASFKNKYILDIKRSQDHGAELLGAGSASDVAHCTRMCCNEPSCDLTLYRVHGLSSSGHNCYMVKCGSPANCKMAQHNEFVAVMFNPSEPSSNAGVGREHSPVDHGVIGNEDNEPQTDSYSSESKGPIHVSHTMVQPMKTESQTTQPVRTESHTIQPVKTEAQTAQHTRTESHTAHPTPVLIQPHSSTSPSSVPENVMNTHENQNNIQQNENPGIEHIGNGVTASSVTPSVTMRTHSVSPSNQYHHDNNHNPTRDPCEVHGCTGGSGIIVLGVLGGLAFIIVFLISVVVTKRLYDNRQRKHFHDVDYLINGMYT